MGGGGNPRRMVSDQTARAIDEEVKDIVESGHQLALSILKENRELLEEIARKILEQEVIEGDELKSLLDRVSSSHVAARQNDAGVETVAV